MSESYDQSPFLNLRAGVIALICGTTLLVVERICAAALGVSGRLGWHALVAWWGANTAMAFIVVAVAALGSAIARRLVRDPERRGRRALVGAVVVGGALAGCAAPLGESLTTGGWISQQSWGFLLRGFPSVAALAIGAVGYALAVLARGKLRAVVAGGGALAAVALVVVDHVVLLGTYPDLHVLLHGVAASLLAFGLSCTPWQPTSRPARAAALVAILVAASAGAAWLTLPLGSRPQLSMASPMANVLMEFTMPRIELDFAEREFARIDPNAGSYLDKRSGDPLPRKDWNVLWITVDTLRSDAVWPGRGGVKKAFSQPADTPFLNDWLKQTVAFEHVYAQASATHRSMPPMFRSLEAYEPTLKVGTPLGAAAARTGRTSMAVVNNFFLEPRYKTSQSLLWGFDVVDIYHKKRQEDATRLLADVLTQHESGRFFTWLHFYNMHEPGYGAGGLQAGKGSLATRYRRSLKWLDAQMKLVIEMLKAQGLADDTIIVFSADHGESIGANRIRNHGPTIYEEEIRVPLSFYIPGVAPRRVSETVGNIDIVPTLWDAMGRRPEPTFRGRSLLGAIQGEKLPPRPYYMENASGEIAGVALENQKLIQKLKSGTTMRFDVAKDPTEDENLFSDGPDDKPLLAALYAKNPNLVKPTSIMGEIAAKSLDQTDAESPGAALRYILNVAARSGDDGALDAAERLFERTPHDVVKLEVLSALLLADKDRAADLARDELQGIDPEREAWFVEGLGSVGVATADSDVFKERFERPIGDDVATAWLHWAMRWDEPAIGGVLVKLAQRVRAAPSADAELLKSMAQVIRVAKLESDERTKLLGFNRWLLDRHDPRITTEAITTAGQLRDSEALTKIRAFAHDGAIRERQASLYALAAIDPDGSVDDIVAAGADPNLVLDAVKALERTGNAKAIPFVEDVAKNHYNWIIRNNAKAALKKLKK